MAKAATVPAEIVGDTPDYILDLASHAGAGISTDAQDFQIPFLAVAQANSPELKKQQADRYIAGLEPGDIFNTATRQFWKGDAGVLVVPAHFQKAVVEWVPRDSGGGYVATHPFDTPLMARTKKSADGRMNLLPGGHQLVETNYHFVTDAATGQPMVVSLTSTGIGVSRAWMTLMKQFQIRRGTEMVVAPSFARCYRLTTVYKKNDVGDWFQLRVEDVGWASRDQVEPAKSFWLEYGETGYTLGRPPLSQIETDASTSDSARDAVDEDKIPI